MIDHILYLLLLIAISVGMSQFLDNCLGYPGKHFANEIDTGAIFFRWTYELSYLRLHEIKGETFIRDLRDRVLGELTDKGDLLIAEKDFKRAVVGEARQYFKIERALGMCVFCTNFWVSITLCLVFGTLNPFQSSIPFYALLLIIPFLSHSILKHANSRTN